MKTQFTIFAILILISSRLFGQLTIDAGNDTIICISVWGVDTTVIGGNPTAIGGTEPYSYAWETNYTIGSNSFGASYFLDDSTKANPKIVNDAPEKLKFILTVSDNDETQMQDSVNIRFSRFAYTLVDYFANINQGDTVTLMHNIGLGIEPLSFSWTPNYNISDTSVSNPRAWPDIDTDYQVIAMDSLGCVSEPDIFEVSVNPLGISMNKKVDSKSIVFPNPIDSKSKIYIHGNQFTDYIIKVINTSGQTVLSDKMDSDSYNIGNKINKSGLYVYLILNNRKIVSSGQFIKR